MNISKVIFGFFVMLALSLNFSFYVGDMHDPIDHNIYELYAAIIVNLIATVLKFGERSHLGAMMLASSLVAVLGLIAAAIVWAYGAHIAEGTLAVASMASVVSLSAGALVANVISVTLLVIESSVIRR